MNGCVFDWRDMVSVLVIRAFGELLVCEAEHLRDLYRSECERFGMIGFVIGVFEKKYFCVRAFVGAHYRVE